MEIDVGFLARCMDDGGKVKADSIKLGLGGLTPPLKLIAAAADDEAAEFINERVLFSKLCTPEPENSQNFGALPLRTCVLLPQSRFHLPP